MLLLETDNCYSEQNDTHEWYSKELLRGQSYPASDCVSKLFL